MKIKVEQSYPGELGEDGAGEKLRAALGAVVVELGLEPLEKAQRGGELVVVEELSELWTQLYKDRVKRLTTAVVEEFERASKPDQ